MENSVKQAENTANQQYPEKVHKVHGEAFLWVNLNNIKQIRRTPEDNRYRVSWIDGTIETFFVNPLKMERSWGREDWVSRR